MLEWFAEGVRKRATLGAVVLGTLALSACVGVTARDYDDDDDDGYYYRYDDDDDDDVYFYRYDDDDDDYSYRYRYNSDDRTYRNRYWYLGPRHEHDVD